MDFFFHCQQIHLPSKHTNSSWNNGPNKIPLKRSSAASFSNTPGPESCAPMDKHERFITDENIEEIERINYN